VLLGLDEGAVGDKVVADDGRGIRRMQTAGEHPDAGRLHRFGHRGDVARDLVEVRRRRFLAVGLVDAEQVPGHAPARR
jgi:hypothetical protein